MHAIQTSLTIHLGYRMTETDSDFHKARHQQRERNTEHLAITILVGCGVLALILSGYIPTQHSSNENLAGWLASRLAVSLRTIAKGSSPLHQSHSALM